MRDPKDTYVKIYRKAWGHPLFNNEPFSKREAFFWMISKANRFPDGLIGVGDLIISRRYLACKWKWSEGRVQRYLQKLIVSDMISTRLVLRSDLILKVSLSYDFFDTDIRSDFAPHLTIATIVNYLDYQVVDSWNGTDPGTDLRADPGTDPGTDPSTNKKESIKKEKESKRKKNPLPPKKLVASHDLEFLQEQLSGINIPDFERKYGPEGLDVIACFNDFTDYILNGTAKNQTPNQANWTAFSRAFHDSCRWAIEHARHLKEQKTPSLAERIGVR